jgi:excisionase family DNA binding protein
MTRRDNEGILVDVLDPIEDVIERRAALRTARQLEPVREKSEIVVRTPDGDLENLPHGFVHLVLTMLEEVAKGHTVGVISEPERISTTAAARLLGVSRPHVVKLIDSGLLPCRMAGSHRRVRMTDLLAYQRSVDRRHAFLDELGADTEAMGLYDGASARSR